MLDAKQIQNYNTDADNNNTQRSKLALGKNV